MALLSDLMLPLHSVANSAGYRLGDYRETLSLKALIEIFARAMLDRPPSDGSIGAYRRNNDLVAFLQDGKAYVNENGNSKNIEVWVKSLSVKEARRHLHNVNIFSISHASRPFVSTSDPLWFRKALPDYAVHIHRLDPYLLLVNHTLEL